MFRRMEPGDRTGAAGATRGIKPAYGQPRICVFKRKVIGHAVRSASQAVAPTLTIVPAVLHIKGFRVRPPAGARAYYLGVAKAGAR